MFSLFLNIVKFVNPNFIFLYYLTNSFAIDLRDFFVLILSTFDLNVHEV